jgi:phosphatidylglycerophosphatase A
MGRAPGTLGSLAAIPLCWLASLAGKGLGAIFVVAFVVFAVWVCERAEGFWGRKDPGCVVIDEIAGMLVAFYGIPVHLLSLSFGFLLFRALDILKPYPIGLLDRRLRGGVGIVGDDVLAGLMTQVALRLLF